MFLKDSTLMQINLTTNLFSQSEHLLLMSECCLFYYVSKSVWIISKLAFPRKCKNFQAKFSKDQTLDILSCSDSTISRNEMSMFLAPIYRV